MSLAPPVTFDLYLDEDRDGAVDASPASQDPWEWGAGGRGAIILANNDDDDGNGTPDNEDERVNGNDDVHELAPLVVRRTGPDTVPAGWTVRISVDDSDLIRIFDLRGGAGREVVGPNKGDTYILPDLDPREFEFGMEAVDFAGTGIDGLVRVTLRTESPSGDVMEKTVELRIAPWIMPNHLDPAERVYVVNAGAYNRRFRRELALLVGAAGCSFTQHPADDVWMQDCMEFGYTSLPNHGIRVVLRAPRNRPLRNFPRTLLGGDLGFTIEGDINTDTTFDSNGNLEVTPPVEAADGTRYPWGRIYYGGVGRPLEDFDPEVEAFLERQVVQRPIKIDTSWLTVGHVDEFISIVPGGPKQFKLLLASPSRAYEILDACSPAVDQEYTVVHGDTLSTIAPRHGLTWQELYNYTGRTAIPNRDRLRSGNPNLIYVGERILVPGGNARFLVGRSFPEFDGAGDYVGERNVETTVERFLAEGIPELHLTAAELRLFNEQTQATIDVTRDQLVDELGLDADQDIIHVPIVFMPNESLPNLADSLTAGMVNMLVINRHCIIPKPFGPVDGGNDLFEQDLRGPLEGLGLTVNFLDDWHEYHVNLGEVHCGTNTLREPTLARWWEFEP